MGARVLFQNDWQTVLEDVLVQPFYEELRAFLKDEYRRYTVYPKMHDLYQALHLTAFAGTRVIILGQDPYHGPGQAHGLSFSVPDGVPFPPSLKNIFLELEQDLGIKEPLSGNLTGWAKQGVLLLNTILSVRAGEPGSHRGRGWEKLTDTIIARLGARHEPLVFMLWGRYAQSKRPLIDESRHLVIASAHPSPLSAHHGFFGSRPFSRANAFLVQHGLPPIDWEKTTL
ncbi:MAG: Uracil-DNA glycosylase, family 1 [Candidatus Carbobacillus altaicus]|uniref:Uracil-DNA glycosylase n=1 Tax=Candidatus Carbonibacillus altaicus TaxID=2163959 RepID=A0A2R6Y5H3_9BACL|nr:MAG: Uracil-DNA glycosylase, family 1 [Candidatus Carbobacillus altaicus]